MPDVLMRLGAFTFGIDTAAYQSLTRTSNYRWSRQQRLGVNDQLQFTGLDSDTIEVEGVVYPDFKGGIVQIDWMRRQAELGVPLLMVAGTGKVLGLWVIEAISEEQSAIGPRGRARRQAFSMRVTRYDGGIRGFVSHLGR